MNLIVDIGNSSAKLALFDGNDLVLHKHLDPEGLDDLLPLAEAYAVECCAISSVGSPLPNVEEMLGEIDPLTLCVTGETPTPLTIDYLTPQTLGSDRLAAAVGAASLFADRDILIIDVGTCITYDYVTRDGHYLGGNISPGAGIRLRSLHEQTERLPLVEIADDYAPIGHDTPSAIESGVLLGMDYEIRGYIAAFEATYPQGKVFLTGGNAYRFATDADVVRHDHLVELGLNKILIYNR